MSQQFLLEAMQQIQRMELGLKKIEGRLDVLERRPSNQIPNQRRSNPRRKDSLFIQGQGTSSSQSQTNRDLKCFLCLGTGHLGSQCTNKLAPFWLDIEEIKTDGEKSDDSMPPLEDTSTCEYSVEGQAREEDE